MPPKIKLTKSEILSTAIDLIREQGTGALNARLLASRLSASTQPIFSNFSCMNELKEEVIGAAYKLYCVRMENELAASEYPPYKATGMAYIRFAKDEPELFKLLFMQKREKGKNEWDALTESTVIPLIMKNLEISRADAEIFHLEMWAYVHGIASMFATGYLNLEWELVSRMVTDAYKGVGSIYGKEEKQ